MSRERPTELPRVILVDGPGAANRVLAERMGALIAAAPALAITQPPAPRESGFGKMLDAFSKFGDAVGAGIASALPRFSLALFIDEHLCARRKVKAFYAQRPRPWRPRSARGRGAQRTR